MINKVENLTINEVRNDSNRASLSELQFQYVVNTAGISHQNLLSSRKIEIRHKEVLVLDTPMEPSIGTKNQPDFTISNGVVQAPQELKTPVIQ